MGFLDDLLGKTILRDGVVLPDRKKLNFIQGTGSAVTVADNPGTGATDVTINLTNAAVAGPGVSTDNAIARWDGTSGALLQNSTVTVTDTGGIVAAPTSGDGATVSAPSAGTGSGLLAQAAALANVGATIQNTAGRALVVTGDTTSPTLAAMKLTPQDAQPTGASQVGDLYMSTAGILWVCTTAGTPGTWTKVGSTEQVSDGIFNCGLVTSVASNALTITLKQANGSSDPAAGDGAVTVYTRGTTAATGDEVIAQAVSATSLVVPSTATLGTSNGVAMYLYVYAVNNAGVLELGVVGNAMIDEGTRQSSTAMSNAADNPGVLYTAVSRTQVGVKLIGRILITEATAGTWATNASEVSPVPFSGTMSNLIGTQTNDNASSGRVGETLFMSRVRSAAASISTGTPLNLTAAAKITLPPGDWWVSGAVGFLPAATTNITYIGSAVSKTSATWPANDTNCVPTAGEYMNYTSYASAGVVPGVSELTSLIPAYRVSVAVNTDLYLLARAAFTVSTLTVFGYLEARRAR